MILNASLLYKFKSYLILFLTSIHYPFYWKFIRLRGAPFYSNLINDGWLQKKLKLSNKNIQKMNKSARIHHQEHILIAWMIFFIIEKNVNYQCLPTKQQQIGVTVRHQKWKIKENFKQCWKNYFKSIVHTRPFHVIRRPIIDILL